MQNVLMLHPALPLSFWSFRETLAMTGKKALLPPLGLLTVVMTAAMTTLDPPLVWEGLDHRR